MITQATTGRCIWVALKSVKSSQVSLETNRATESNGKNYERQVDQNRV